MKKNKIILISAISIIVLGICGYFFLKGSSKDSIQLVTTKMSVSNISTSVTATRTIEPISEVEVGTQVSGKISNIYVDYIRL